MALFSSVLGQLFELFAHLLRRREPPQSAQQCPAQGLVSVEKPPECEAFDCTASDRKRRKRRRKVPEKSPLGGRREEKEMPSVELMEGGSELREAGEKKRKVRKRKERKITEPTPLLVVVKPLYAPVRASFLKPIEEELLSSVPGHLDLPAARVKPLPPVTRPPVNPQKADPAPEDVSLPSSLLQVDPPKLLPFPSCSDEVVALQRPPSRKPLPFASSPFEPLSSTPAPERPPSRKPLPFASSPFEPPSLLMLVDLEDEEDEYVEYTGKIIRASDLLKSDCPQTLKAEMKPRKMFAWSEKYCEEQEDAWASEVVEVQGFEEEEGDPSEMGDSKAVQGHLDDASLIDEPVMKLFCAASSDGPKNETQHNVNIQKRCKRKKPLVLFNWVAEKAKKNEEKKIIKEKERREKELLLERYMNDPKLKHLWINKHNRNYSSS